VLVLSEYYPRATHAANGIWAHRQALAARDAGAAIRVLVLHRPIPPLSAIKRRDLSAAIGPLRQPRQAVLDGLNVEYLRYLSPPRPLAYDSWGAWAAPLLAARLRALRRRFPFDLIHAHYAVPAGDAVRRAAPDAPLVISVHGHDVYGAGLRSNSVARALGHARLVLANSAGTARRSAAHGARQTRVVHLGADIPTHPQPQPDPHVNPSSDTLVTVANLVSRKRHEDVIRALALLRARHRDLRYVIVGDGPEREPLRALARATGVEAMVEFHGALPHTEAAAIAHASSLFVMPSVDEAFGVAYAEAMAGGVPAIATRGEDGPEEIAARGGGMVLVPRCDPPALAQAIDELLRDPARRAALAHQARATIERDFTWERCGRETLNAYREALLPAPIAPPG
jgi:glycosyltransferase involved in cell wall biosynthesis